MVQSDTKAEAQRPQDCLPCRLVGAGAFTGIGTYALFEAHRQGAFAKHPPAVRVAGGGRITAVLGVGKCSSGGTCRS